MRPSKSDRLAHGFLGGRTAGAVRGSTNPDFTFHAEFTWWSLKKYRNHKRHSEGARNVKTLAKRALLLPSFIQVRYHTGLMHAILPAEI